MNEPELLGQAHFWIGCLCVVSGFGAFSLRKGEAPHRIAGISFAVSMLLLTATGLWLSITREILFTVFLSAIAFHAVATGWAAARMDNVFGRIPTAVSPVLSGAITAGAAYGGFRAAAAPGGVLNDLPPVAFFIVAGVALLLFAFDVRFAIGEAPNRRRITRHLWRMGFSFFLATGIFFFGNNHVLPEALRAPALLALPVSAVVVWTVVDSVRVRFLASNKA